MIRVSVPATSANCSVGFDSLGLALEMRAVFTFEKSDHLKVTGCPAEFCSRDNLVIQAFDKVCEMYGKEKPDFHLHINTEVPFARGLGSSSTCVAAGVFAANEWHHLQLDTETLLKIATALEGHPDNVAPAILGRMTACFVTEDAYGSEIIYSQFDPSSFHALAVIPDYEVSTPEARKVLPSSVSLKDAAAQIGRALVFEDAIVKGEQEKLYTACRDILHEPYRKKLIPNYEFFRTVSEERKLPFWISGSGSTMLYLSVHKDELEDLKKHFEQIFPTFEFRVLETADKGTVIENV